MLTAVLSFTAAAAVIVLLPGPDTLVVLRGMVSGGRAKAVRTALGVLCGLCIWVAAAVAGVAALLRASETGYTVLRIVGAAYLVVLGVQTLLARRSMSDSSADAAERKRRALIGSGFVGGIATDLLNPKVGVFFVTFLPPFVPHGRPVAATSLLLGTIFVVLTALYFTVLIAAAARVTRWLNDAHTRRRLERGTGAVLLGFGLRLAVER